MAENAIPLSLHQLTVTDVDSEGFVDIAGELGCDHVCLFLDMPGGQSAYPRVKTVEQARQLRQRVEDKGMSVFNTDTFLCAPHTVVSDYERMVEIAATLGAQVIDIVSIHDNPEAAAEIVSDFTRLVRSHGMRTIMEPIRYTKLRNLDDAMQIITLCGDLAPAINLDVMHLIRSGRRPADVAKIDPALRYYVQISDGPLEQPDDLYRAEANGDRGVPGTGEFPLVEFLRLLPPGGVVAAEVPLTRLKDSVPPLERARMVVNGARSVLAKAAEIVA
jgi:sugar phosphate isomerase/epimerase